MYLRYIGPGWSAVGKEAEMFVLADWIDVAGGLAIPVGIVLGALVAWKLGAFRQGYEKGKEQREKWFGKKR